MLVIAEIDFIPQSPFNSPFKIEVLLSMYVLQLKGDSLRCCFSSNKFPALFAARPRLSQN